MAAKKRSAKRSTKLSAENRAKVKKFKEWLAGLKVGHEVAVDVSHYDVNTYYRRGLVINIKRTTITVQVGARDREFRRKDGREDAPGKYSYEKLHPIDSKVLQRWQQQKALDRLTYAHWARLPLEVLEQVVAILDAAQKDTEV